MRKGDKPEEYRQMRPKMFPSNNHSGNSQQMLQEIRNSLRNMTKPSDPPKADMSGSGKMLAEDPRQQGRSSNPKNPHHRALQEIRMSLLPFANEPSYSSEKHMSLDQPWVSHEESGYNPCGSGLKASGSTHLQQPVVRKPSWKGSRESLTPRHGPGFPDGHYRSDSPGPPPAFPHPHPTKQRVTPPQVRSVTPPPNRGAMPSTPSWDNPPTKRNIDYPVSRISAPQNQRGTHQPIIMQNTGPNKFTFPNWSQNSSPQSDYLSGSRQPPPPYPVNQSSRHSPTDQAGGPASSPSYVNGGSLPQSMMVPNRNSHNLDMYGLGPPQTWSQAPSNQLPVSSGNSSSNQDLSPSWQNIPVRSNSFTNPNMNGRACHPANSQPSATTVTAITQAPILQPVKSKCVQKPELHTAVAPTHPPWAQPPPQPPPQAAPAYPEPTSPAVPQISVVPEAPSYQGPPPPYPKHLLQQTTAPSPPAYEPAAGKASAAEDEASSGEALRDRPAENHETATEKEKKQITTSPVPLRRNKDAERRGESGRVALYSPQAFKFFMEQHVENILKNHQMRIRRRKQLESEMNRVGLSPEAQEQMRMMLCQKESNYIRLKRAKMEKSMFKIIKTLGIGAFGKVCLARKEDTGALYAMKTLRKKDVLLRNQVAHVKAERDILAEADNEWVVRLYYSFQDKDNLYFVMEYIPGGDMMSLLIRLGIFREELAQFYIAELTCAVESVHKMGFIHRDIKPDNILIDRDGHIKLTDFGLCTGFRWTHDSKYYQSGDHVRQDSMDFSKEWEDPSNCRCTDRLKPLERRKARQHQRCLAHSLVGTPNYIAPEVLLRTGYTQLCDWWSVGVILYEMVVGQPPFFANTPMETQLKVINWKSALLVPPAAKLSPEASDLIIKLCRGHEDRLGKNGTDEIKEHPFFKSIDFSSDLRQQGAPYVPTIAHSTDTSNFDPVDPDKLWSDDSDDEENHNDTLNGWFRNGKHPEHAFYEFTFRRFFDDNGHPYSCPKPIQYEEDEAESDRGAQEVVSELAAQGRDLVYV
uniref:non-specific serine/threonine protein kinase n=1 Tax=Neogobius melanostomus TaxID=47308 RepID=A0A8C6TPC6_9GOBI